MRRGAKAALPPIPGAAPPQPDRKRKLGLNDIFSGMGKSKGTSDNSKHLFVYYETSTGNIHLLIQKLMMDVTEQRAWLTVWMRLDADRTNRLGFNDFCEVFKFSKSYEWSRRVFDIINTKLTGYISLDEFLTFCLTFLILDADATRLFTFRLLSRRAGTSDARTILDIQDIKTFIKFAYKIRSNQADKVASEIFLEMDTGEEVGLALSEFSTYSVRNPTFLTFGTAFLTHFRLCLFGYDFWLKRSRKVKKSRAVGLGSFIRLRNANVEAEVLTDKLMKRSALFNGKTSRKRGGEGAADKGRGEGGRRSRKGSGEASKDTQGGGLPAVEEPLPPPLAPPSAGARRRSSLMDRLTGGRGSRRTSVFDLFQKVCERERGEGGKGGRGGGILADHRSGGLVMYHL